MIPLPPLAEQKAIVEKVGALMMTCRALEAQIEHSRTYAANLLQAVLREAFSGKFVAQDANDKPVPTTAKVIPFPIRIGNISPTDLQAGVIAMAYQRHEQAPKFLQHFHHVKAEKIVHLGEAHLGMDMERVPIKAQLGQNDYPRLKKVEFRAQKKNWFDVWQEKNGGAYTYYKKSSFDALLEKVAAALGERAAEVNARAGEVFQGIGMDAQAWLDRHRQVQVCGCKITAQPSPRPSSPPSSPPSRWLPNRLKWWHSTRTAMCERGW